MTGYDILTMDALKSLKEQIDKRIPYKVRTMTGVDNSMEVMIAETRIEKNLLIGKTVCGLEIVIGVAE